MLLRPLHNVGPFLPYTHATGEGYGLVEAPRGPLIHHYVIEGGKIAKGEFIIPTVHNMLPIERALRVAAKGISLPTASIWSWNGRSGGWCALLILALPARRIKFFHDINYLYYSKGDINGLLLQLRHFP